MTVSVLKLYTELAEWWPLRSAAKECEHIAGDMRTLRVQRQFDAVFVHDAIAYMTTLHDLQLALETCFMHCRSEGGVVILPDCVRDTFKPSTKHGGHDGEERALRYLEWTWDPDRMTPVTL